MPRHLMLFFTLSSLFLSSAGKSQAQTLLVLDLGGQPLGIGDPAPKLTVREFVRGEAVQQFEKGKVYVVEFWKCGCPPCRAAIPHLTELQQKYPDVVIISVGVITSTRDNKEFVKKMGDKMGYRVAVDAVPEGKDAEEAGAMVQGWLQPAGQNGVPTTFIIDGNGKIAWIGHPEEMEKPLEKIRAGEWDFQAAATEFDDKADALARAYPGVLGRYYAGTEARRRVAHLLELEQAAVRTIQKLAGRVIVVVKGNSVTQVRFSPSESTVTDVKLKELVKEFKQLKGLRALQLGNTEVTDVGLKDLKELKELKKLWFLNLDHTRVTGSGLKELQELKGLRALRLNGTQVTDAGLKELKQLQGLQDLHLNGTQVTDAGLKELKQLQGLQSLHLNGTQVTDAGLKELKQLQGLQSLHLNGTQVTDAGLKELKQLQGLQMLRLDGTQVTDAGLKELQRLEKLQILDLGGTQVTDTGLEDLKELKELEELDLSRTKVTKEGVNALRKDLPKLSTVIR